MCVNGQLAGNGVSASVHLVHVVLIHRRDILVDHLLFDGAAQKRRCTVVIPTSIIVRLRFHSLARPLKINVCLSSNFANALLSAFGAFTVRFFRLSSRLLSTQDLNQGAMLTDKIGRRRRLYVGAFVLACLLATVAALSSKCTYPRSYL